MNYIKLLGYLRPVLGLLSKYGVKLFEFALEYVKDLEGKDASNEEKRHKAVTAIQWFVRLTGKEISKEEAERLIKIAIIVIRLSGK
jgi:hypothetical protein